MNTAQTEPVHQIRRTSGSRRGELVDAGDTFRRTGRVRPRPRHASTKPPLFLPCARLAFAAVSAPRPWIGNPRLRGGQSQLKQRSGHGLRTRKEKESSSGRRPRRSQPTGLSPRGRAPESPRLVLPPKAHDACCNSASKRRKETNQTKGNHGRPTQRVQPGPRHVAAGRRRRRRRGDGSLPVPVPGGASRTAAAGGGRVARGRRADAGLGGGAGVHAGLVLAPPPSGPPPDGAPACACPAAGPGRGRHPAPRAQPRARRPAARAVRRCRRGRPRPAPRRHLLAPRRGVPLRGAGLRLQRGLRGPRRLGARDPPPAPRLEGSIPQIQLVSKLDIHPAYAGFDFVFFCLIYGMGGRP
jgi:hypothetical protein